MEMTSRQRMLAFALTVLALAALGSYLFVSGTAKKTPASAPSSHPPTVATTPPTVPPASAQPTGSTASSSQVNIYRWLPFSEQGLSRASAVVTEFSAYYGTYSYTDSTASYTGRMQGLASNQLIQIIARGFSTPGLASARRQEKQVATGTAVIDSLRAFGPSSITFVVTINQKISTNHGPTPQSTQYAVTVSNSGGGWQVTDIELASSGNQ
ncbi:MAG TPA: hypothetical protein VKS82_01940 [Streptosporangiaceae bacterium]|nr:hypothetical protein [Streptosporangiaceae bacterium]